MGPILVVKYSSGYTEFVKYVSLVSCVNVCSCISVSHVFGSLLSDMNEKDSWYKTPLVLFCTSCVKDLHESVPIPLSGVRCRLVEFLGFSEV